MKGVVSSASPVLLHTLTSPFHTWAARSTNEEVDNVAGKLRRSESEGGGEHCWFWADDENYRDASTRGVFLSFSFDISPHIRSITPHSLTLTIDLSISSLTRSKRTVMVSFTKLAKARTPKLSAGIYRHILVFPKEVAGEWLLVKGDGEGERKGRVGEEEEGMRPLTQTFSPPLPLAPPLLPGTLWMTILWPRSHLPQEGSIHQRRWEMGVSSIEPIGAFFYFCSLSVFRPRSYFSFILSSFSLLFLTLSPMSFSHLFPLSPDVIRQSLVHSFSSDLSLTAT